MLFLKNFVQTKKLIFILSTTSKEKVQKNTLSRLWQVTTKARAKQQITNRQIQLQARKKGRKIHYHNITKHIKKKITPNNHQSNLEIQVCPALKQHFLFEQPLKASASKTQKTEALP